MGQIILGTEIKLNIHIDRIENLSMDNFDFKFDFYTTPQRKITVTKSQARRVDEDNYIVMINTQSLGVGNLRCEVTAKIPDSDFEDYLRTEKALFNTGIVISKSI